MILSSFQPVRRASLLLLALAASCGSDANGDGGARGADRGRGRGGSSDSADGGIDIVTRTKYAVTAVAQAGAIDGVVKLDGAAPPDSTYQVGPDSARCGATVVARAVTHRDGAVADAVVWLDDVKNGKPHPELRRLELSHERCQYAPRVQAASAPSTLNVLNDDRAVHVTTITRIGASKPLLSIPFTDDGQVVPTQLAARESGVVEVKCVQHPWATAYVAAFDHPYYAVTGADGRFRLDGVPPGRYTLKVWHPRGKTVASQAVTVPGSGTLTLEARLGVQ